MKVQLPVKTTLRQNDEAADKGVTLCNYQSKRRCAKTVSA